MKKKYVIKDSTGKYYTGRWDWFWTRDPESAMEFDSEDAIDLELGSGTDSDTRIYKLDGSQGPYELITLLEF